MNHGPDYVMASRQGLFIVNRAEWRRVAEGYFFGVTVKGRHVYCFKTVSNRDPEADANPGSIVRYEYRDGALIGPESLVTGLNKNCHQVDFFDGAFYVVDTSNQRILEFDAQWRQIKIHQVLPPVTAGGPEDPHINSLLGLGDTIYVMFHNGWSKIPSEIVEFDRNFRERRRIVLPSTGCHDIVRLEDGRLLFCDSFKGQVARDDGASFKIDELYTRGLSVSDDEIAVGSSLYGRRLRRVLLPGFVTFLNRSYERTGRLYVPAAATQIRRLDGADLSLSQPR